VAAAVVSESLLLGGCAKRPTPPIAPAPDQATSTVHPESAASGLAAPDLARGEQVFLDKQCVACHGSQVGTGVATDLAGTSLSFDEFLHIQRTAKPPKPAFNELELSDQDAYNVYSWLKQLSPDQSTPVAPAPTLAPGEVLGMTVWTEYGCDGCHGAYAQGSPEGPGLAGINFPYEMERARMRQTADTIPEHAAGHMNDTVLQALYEWLKNGAGVTDRCVL
jgi:mono/diheme cytochrome c family protein